MPERCPRSESLCAEAGQGLPPFPAPLSPLAASFLRCAPDKFLLTKPNTSSTIKVPASLRSDGVRVHPGMPFGIIADLAFGFAGIPTMRAESVLLAGACSGDVLSGTCFRGLLDRALTLVVNLPMAETTFANSSLIKSARALLSIGKSHYASLGLRIGGALMTFLRSFRNFRYSGVVLMSRWLSSSAFSLGFGSCDITPPPDWSEFSNRGASRRPIRELCGSAPYPYRGVHCSETIVRQGI